MQCRDPILGQVEPSQCAEKPHHLGKHDQANLNTFSSFFFSHMLKNVGGGKHGLSHYHFPCRTFWGEIHSTQLGIVRGVLSMEQDGLISDLSSVTSNCLTTGR